MSDANPDLAILVFAKAPVAGAAKTRLIPLLGADGAAELQGRLLRHALATARAAAPAKLDLWCTPDAGHPALVAAAGDADATLQVQSSGDLGERMAQAFVQSLAHTKYAICIGTDCPALTVRHFHDAAAALRAGHDAVISPAEDGGYTLIGLSRNEPRLFAGISWSSDQVMSQTRERLRDCGLRWQELETLWDVDRPEDWQRLRQSGLIDKHETPPA